MIKGKRGGAEFALFLAVALIALGGMIFVSVSSGATGMAPRPYIYDPETTQRGTLNDYWHGLTNSVIVTQKGDYGDCRWECLANERVKAFNLSSARPETKACFENCAIQFGQPPWGYAGEYTGAQHYLG